MDFPTREEEAAGPGDHAVPALRAHSPSGQRHQSPESHSVWGGGVRADPEDLREEGAFERQMRKEEQVSEKQGQRRVPIQDSGSRPPGWGSPKDGGACRMGSQQDGGAPGQGSLQDRGAPRTGSLQGSGSGKQGAQVPKPSPAHRSARVQGGSDLVLEPQGGLWAEKWLFPDT